MTALITALLAFGAFGVAHVILWRLRRPATQYAGLVKLCLAVLVVALVSLSALSRVVGAVVTPLDYLNVVILYAALALPYFTTYSAVQADSPAMAILLRIEEAGARGLTREEMVEQLDDDILVLPRLRDLVEANLVAFDGSRYRIGAPGTLMAKTHLRYRALLRMEKGG